MKIDCSIAETMKADFGALWRCSQRGNAVEVVTPFPMPDSTFLSLFFTQRGERLIACDGGGIWEVIRNSITGPKKDALIELRTLAADRHISEGENDGGPVFFKECKDEKLLSSIAFDLAHFAVAASNAIPAKRPATL